MEKETAVPGTSDEVHGCAAEKTLRPRMGPQGLCMVCELIKERFVDIGLFYGPSQYFRIGDPFSAHNPSILCLTLVNEMIAETLLAENE